MMECLPAKGVLGLAIGRCLVMEIWVDIGCMAIKRVLHILYLLQLYFIDDT